jgi:hypothetical protein
MLAAPSGDVRITRNVEKSFRDDECGLLEASHQPFWPID